MTSSTGCRSDSRPTTPRRPSRTLPWRRSSAVVVGRSGSAPAADRRPAVSGKRRTTSSAAGPARRASSASSTAWKRGRSARMIAPYGSSNPGRNARPRITAKGSSRPATRRPSSATKRETPTPPRPSRRTVVATPSDAASSAGASRTNAASRPTNRALLIVAGMSGILGVPTTGSGRKTRSGAGAGREERGQHIVIDIAVEAGRRGVADDLAEGHLVEPALAAVRAENQPVRARSFDQLDLVALVELADLRRAQLIGCVEEADHGIADRPPLAAIGRADGAVFEAHPVVRRHRAGWIGLARLEE